MVWDVLSVLVVEVFIWGGVWDWFFGVVGVFYGLNFLKSDGVGIGGVFECMVSKLLGWINGINCLFFIVGGFEYLCFFIREIFICKLYDEYFIVGMKFDFFFMVVIFN